MSLSGFFQAPFHFYKVSIPVDQKVVLFQYLSDKYVYRSTYVDFTISMPNLGT